MRKFVAALLVTALGLALARSYWTHRELVAEWLAPQVRLAHDVRVPLECAEQHLFVGVRLGSSRRLNFELDTGASRSMIDLGLARELGVELGDAGAMGGAGAEATRETREIDAAYTLADAGEVGGSLALALPLHAEFSARFGTNFDGVLGCDFFRRYAVELDYAARELTLHDRSRFRDPGSGTAFELEFDSERQPLVRAVVTPIGGAPIAVRFKLDTGSGTALTLHAPFVAAHRLPGDGVEVATDVPPHGVGGDVRCSFARIAELRLGPFIFSRPVACLAYDDAGSFADASIDGNLGGPLLERFRVILDLRAARLWLAPPVAAAVDRPACAFSDRAFSGLAFEARGERFEEWLITRVLADSPSGRAGVCEGDRVLSIDGERAPELDTNRLHALLRTSGSHRMELARGERVLTAEWTARTLR